MFQSETVTEIYKALVKAQSEFKAIPFDKKNPHFGSPYASLSATLEMVRPVMGKNGLAIIQAIHSGSNAAENGKSYAIETKLIHTSGEWLSSEFHLIIDKHNMQGLGSAITYAKRYAAQAILGICGDDDDDGNAASTSSKDATTKTSGKNTTEKKDYPSVDPEKFVLSLGDIKNKPLGEIPLETLEKISAFLSDAIKKDPKKENKNTKFYGVAIGNVRKVIEKKKLTSDPSQAKRSQTSTTETIIQDTTRDTEGPPDFDEPPLDESYMQHYPEEISNLAEGFQNAFLKDEPEDETGSIIIKINSIPEIQGLRGQQINKIPDDILVDVVKILDNQLKKIPKIQNSTDAFILMNNIKTYLKKRGI